MADGSREPAANVVHAPSWAGTAVPCSSEAGAGTDPSTPVVAPSVRVADLRRRLEGIGTVD